MNILPWQIFSCHLTLKMKDVRYILIALTVLTGCSSSEQKEESQKIEEIKETVEVVVSQLPSEDNAIKDEYASIAIIEYNKDPRAIIVTEVTSSSITIGLIDESTGEFYEGYQKIENNDLLKQLSPIFNERYTESPEKIGESCEEEDFYIGLSIKKKPDENYKNITFVNHYDENLEEGISLINQVLTDSLYIIYNKQKTMNCN